MSCMEPPPFPRRHTPDLGKEPLLCLGEAAAFPWHRGDVAWCNPFTTATW